MSVQLHRFRRFTLIGLLCLCPSAASAHDFRITGVTVRFLPDQNYQIDLACDLDARLLALPPGKVLLGDLRAFINQDPDDIARGFAELESQLRRQIRIRFDGRPAEFAIAYPSFSPEDLQKIDPAAVPTSPPADAPPAHPPLGAQASALPGEVTLLGHTARFTGQIPSQARAFSFSASRSFGPVNLAVYRADHPDPATYVLEPGATSPSITINEVDESPGTLAVAGQYLRLGFEHILPYGLDHILFVLGLFLLSPKLRPLLWQVSAFTVAHTLTLGLSMYGVISLPSAVVEPLIALSIAFVAIENLFTTTLKPWRPAVVFGFGLLHGAGFAGALSELGLPRSQFATALFSFNAGVETGQLAIIAIAFAIVGSFRRKPWYRARVIVPCSAAIALIGLFWSMQRTYNAVASPVDKNLPEPRSASVYPCGAARGCLCGHRSAPMRVWTHPISA